MVVWVTRLYWQLHVLHLVGRPGSPYSSRKLRVEKSMSIAGLIFLMAVGIPAFLYWFINYANRKFKQMDMELERRTETASLTTSELQAMIQEAVEESTKALSERVEDAELQLKAMYRLLDRPQLLDTSELLSEEPNEDIVPRGQNRVANR